jgi:DNA-binding GntR family transcriptional regulator
VNVEPLSAPVSSSDQIVRDVLRGLYEGRYVAGQRLVEPDLMRRYAVGRSTVREAIKRLAAEGVVAAHPFRGAQIRQLSRADAKNILLILELLIGLAARQSAETIASHERRELFVQSYDHLLTMESEDDSFEVVRARNRFYRTMTRVAGNAELERLLPIIQVHLVRAQLKIPRNQRLEDYRAIAETVLSGDPARAEGAGRAHVARMTAVLDTLPDSAFAPISDETTEWNGSDA